MLAELAVFVFCSLSECRTCAVIARQACEVTSKAMLFEQSEKTRCLFTIACFDICSLLVMFYLTCSTLRANRAGHALHALRAL